MTQFSSLLSNQNNYQDMKKSKYQNIKIKIIINDESDFKQLYSLERMKISHGIKMKH
jgi:hypothetical protein